MQPIELHPDWALDDLDLRSTGSKQDGIDAAQVVPA
jgi:hypothetical protein